jgi:hypothetical protein
MKEVWTKFWVLAFVVVMSSTGNFFFKFEEVGKTCQASLSATGTEEGMCAYPVSAVQINETEKSDRISAASNVRVIVASN